MPYVDAEFEAKLKRMDKRLRVRYSHITGKFYIEEKLPRDAVRDPALARTRDEFIRRVEGYDLVLSARRLDWRIFSALYNADMQRFGGAEKYADWIEAEERREEEVIEQQQTSRLDDISHEAFNKALWLTQNPGKEIAR
jgi:hypothetical protein